MDMKLYNFNKFNESKGSIESITQFKIHLINFICNKYNITNYTIDEEGLINVEGSVNLSGNYLSKLPLNFGEVTGNFNCRYNKLTSLEGSPKKVGGDFDCSDNNLFSLIGPAEKVGGNFNCSFNFLKTLLDGPEDFLICIEEL